jgi:hypothetical protein
VKHALLSPSSADRWIACPPSARLCENVTDTGSTYAQEGSDAHTLCEHKLRKIIGEKTKDPRKHLTYYDKQMEDTTDDYVTYCLEQLERVKAAYLVARLFVEQRVKYDEYVPDGRGTADCVIVSDGEMVVIDFKYGEGVPVQAEDNPQLMLYALGCLLAFDGIYDIEIVKMCVVQPRRESITEAIIYADALYHWARDIVKPAAELAWNGDGEQQAGKHCQFCKVKAKCRARAEANLALAKYEFQDPPLLENDEIAAILTQADELAGWVSDVKDYALQAALRGEKFHGFKLVAGRSNREYTDEDAIADRLRRAGYYNIFKVPKLLGLTEMTKILGKVTFGVLLEGATKGEDEKPTHEPLIVKPPGKPTLVPESDKRQPIKINSAADDFADHELEDDTNVKTD